MQAQIRSRLGLVAGLGQLLELRGLRTFFDKLRTAIHISNCHHLLKNQPLSVGFFSPASPSVGTGSGAWPLELAHPQVAIFGVDSAVFCSLFSVALLNIQGQMSCIGAGLRAIGLLFRLLWRTRPKQRKAQKNRFAAACRCGTDVSASLASRRLSTS